MLKQTFKISLEIKLSTQLKSKPKNCVAKKSFRSQLRKKLVRWNDCFTESSPVQWKQSSFNSPQDLEESFKFKSESIFSNKTEGHFDLVFCNFYLQHHNCLRN